MKRKLTTRLLGALLALVLLGGLLPFAAPTASAARPDPVRALGTTYEVWFYLDAADPEPLYGLDVEEGALVPKPEDPGREHMDFGGWYLDRACTQPYDFSAPVCANLILYGKWTYVNPFTDIKPKHYFYNAVLWAYYHDPQITSGTTDTAFCPNETCTRAQVVTFLWNALGKPDSSVPACPFTDVKPGAYYFQAVLWALSEGVTSGVSDTRFGVKESCTRAQTVTLLWNALGKPEPETANNPFTDVKPKHYFYKAVLWAVENGVTSGVDDTHFGPNQTCTRGQIVMFLYNALAGEAVRSS